MGFVLLNSVSLQDRLEIRRLMLSGSCLIILGGSLDLVLMYMNISGPTAERIKKDITRHFKNHGLNITIQTNMKTVNYLDVTFNLNSGTYYPYRKPNDQPLYINTKSNHPPRIIKDNETDYRVQWTIIIAAQPYNNISKRCDLCPSEKLYIINGHNNSPLNKRSELISKCRHENKYYSMKNSIT